MHSTHKVRCSTGGFRCRLGAGLGFAFLLAATPAIQAESGQSSWAAIEDDRGITLVPVLACRTREALTRVTSSAPENRAVFVRLSVKQGECTRLPLHTPFIPIDRTSGVLHVRTMDLGRLWVSQATRVLGLAEMPLAGRLVPESSEPVSTSGLTADEQEAVDALLAEKETVPGFMRGVRIGGRSHVQGGSHNQGARNGGGQSGSYFDQVQLVSWRPVLGGSNSRHPSSDGVGLDRCAEVRVRYDGSGSRLVSPSSFTARFASGKKRSGQHFLSSIRLSGGESGAGVVCFGGNFMTNIVELELD